jgi:hypothetical protein
MSVLVSQFSALTKEQRDALGRPSSKLNTRGAHRVRITDAYEVEGSRVKIDLQTADGLTTEIVLFLGKDKEQDKKVAEVNRALGTLKRISIVTKENIDQVIASAAKEPMTISGEKVTITKFKQLIGREFIVLVYSQIEQDKNNTVYVKGTVDTDKFYDIEGRSDFEVSMNKPASGALEASKEAILNRIEIKYSDRSKPLCIKKLKELQNGGVQASNDSSVASDDDIF